MNDQHSPCRSSRFLTLEISQSHPSILSLFWIALSDHSLETRSFASGSRSGLVIVYQEKSRLATDGMERYTTDQFHSLPSFVVIDCSNGTERQ